MNPDEIDQLAEAMLRKQGEAAAKKAADDAEAARVAEAAAEKAAAEREAAERPAREAAAKVEAEAESRRSAVLGAGVRDVFVDQDGTEHRVADRVDGPGGTAVHTVGSTKDGKTVIGVWGPNRDNSALAGWKKV